MQNSYPMSRSCPDNSSPYIIKSGDTLYEIAKEYDTTVEEILSINPGVNPNNLQIGQRICIPEESSSSEECPKGTFSYTIKKGDTLYNLAMEYNTTVDEILKPNPKLRPNNLKIGERICLPDTNESVPECDGLYYIIRPGDTLYLISNKCNVSIQDILNANPSLEPGNLQIGRLICIPNKREDSIDCKNGMLYTVKENDSLASILLRFNISVMDLEEGNPNLDIDNIKLGEKICILEHIERGCPCPKGHRPYMIEYSDLSIDKAVIIILAERFNTTVSNLLKVNSNLCPGDFEIGRYICVPNK